MIKQRQIFQSIILEYSGTPTITVSIDGTDKLTNLVLPEHTIRKTRIVDLPAGVIGYVPQLRSSHTDVFRFQFQGVPETQYQAQHIYHYWEITFQGTVNVSLFLDEVAKKPNNLGSDTITLTARDSRSQDTRRVYYPPLSYGWVPHYRHNVTNTNSGQILNARPVQLPPRFYKGLKDHSEIRITHEGFVQVAMYLDGEEVDQYQFDASNTNDFVTEKAYLPSGSNGQVLQWIQYGGDGEIAVLESDVTLTDQEPPNQELQ